MARFDLPNLGSAFSKYFELVPALTDATLARHFARLGVEIKQIGGAVEHRGMRVPSMMSVSSIVAGLNFIVRPLYAVIADEVRRAVREQRESRQQG